MKPSTPCLGIPQLSLWLLFVLAVPAHAGLYKCAGEKGAVVYQDSPCASGTELRNLDLDPATLSVVPGTPLPSRIVKPTAPAREAKIRATSVRSRGGDPAERKFLRMGMTQAEVLHRIGRPDTQLGARRKEGQQWSYLPTAGDADTLTTVTFAGGAVSRVERKVVR
jgi:uncharacterized protein DUF4124